MESRCDEADTAASLPKAIGAVPGGVRDTAGGDPVVAGGAGGAVRVPLLRAALPGVLRRVQVRLRWRQAVRLLRRRRCGVGTEAAGSSTRTTPMRRAASCDGLMGVACLAYACMFLFFMEESTSG